VRESVGDEKPVVPCLVTCKILATYYKPTNLKHEKEWKYSIPGEKISTEKVK
jgi:hypothetical protein